MRSPHAAPFPLPVFLNFQVINKFFPRTAITQKQPLDLIGLSSIGPKSTNIPALLQGAEAENYPSRMAFSLPQEKIDTPDGKRLRLFMKKKKRKKFMDMVFSPPYRQKTQTNIGNLINIQRSLVIFRFIG